MHSIKELWQKHVDEITEGRYGKPYYELPDALLVEIGKEADQLVADDIANAIDRLRDYHKYKDVPLWCVGERSKTMSAVASHKVHDELCQVLGLDPSTVEGLVVTSRVGHIVEIEVTMFPTLDEVKKMTTTIKHYRVLPYDEEEQEAKQCYGSK